MITEENLSKIYEGVLKKQELTTKELNGYGFNSKDLSDLIEYGTLERIKRGYYSLKSVDDLYYYGKKLISMKEYGKATEVFQKCYELDPNHFKVCLQLFLRCIKSENYEKAFEYFDNIYDTDNKYYNADSNYYLYLLSMITKLPERYRQYAKFLKLEDIIVDFKDKRYNDISAQNKIRISSLNQRFFRAIKQHNFLIKQNDGLSVQDIIIKYLLNQALKEQIKSKSHIIKLVNEKKYEEVIEYFESIQECHNLSIADECTLSLARDLIGIIRTGIIPEKQIFHTDKLLSAINGKNYELALYLSSDYLKEKNIDTDDNAMYVLLSEINNLINKKKNFHSEDEKQKVQEIKTVVDKEQEPQKEEIKSKPIISSSSNSTFANIIDYLMRNDLDNSFIALRSYLNSIDKKQYEFLIIDLIKISLIEGDAAFTKPMIALNYIARENFEFNISEYIQNFYEALAQNNFDVARIYLDIISKSNNLGQSCILTDGLEQVLNDTEKMMHYQSNNEILNKVEQSLQNTPDILVPIIENDKFVENTPSIDTQLISEQPIIEKITTQKIEQNTDKITKSKIKTYDDKDFISQKLDKLYKKGIVLLKPMDNERRKGIYNIVNEIPNVVSFSIGSENSRQVVLRFKPDINEDIDFKELTNIAKEAYSNKDYPTSIKAYRKILECEEPKTYVYVKLGIDYMKMYDIDTAIDYLTIATELSKNEDIKYDFTDLIDNLKGLIPEEDKKKYVKMSTADFEYGIDEYYEIEQVKQVMGLISSGYTLDDACLSLGLDEEEKCIITLIYAKEYYTEKNYKVGDQYLKKVERTKNKTKLVKNLFEEVKKNKKFYSNRKDKHFQSI